jgi:hypothetical protein
VEKSRRVKATDLGRIISHSLELFEFGHIHLTLSYGPVELAIILHYPPTPAGFFLLLIQKTMPKVKK